ncbi:hypothetical protein ACOSQ3_007866 [Xanthoceras sorbifolium]
MEITLRPYQLSDVHDFMEWANDDEVILTSRLRHYTSMEDAMSYLQDEAIPHPWYRAICLDGHPVGFISVKPGSADDERCKGLMSYALGPRHHHKFPDMQRLQAIVDVDNKASDRVLEKAGFIKEGVFRKYVVVKGKTIDAAVYSLLSSD